MSEEILSPTCELKKTVMQNIVGRKRERGQTIILVAISLVSLLAMAALAIDVVTLYVARSEIQRAADAAALAGAKAMADSGLTSLPTSDPAFSSGDVQTLAQSMANAAITAALAAPNNQVAGVAAAPGSPTFNFTTSGGQSTPINNPHVTVSLQRTALPTFFAHIWGRTAATVAASATAEAYNPANTSSFTLITPKAVKPWLVANIDPATSQPFINPTTGAVESGVVANSDFWLTADCQGGFHHRCHLVTNPPGLTTSTPPELQYVPALVTGNSANVCHSSSCAGSGSDYENSIQCADMNPYSCGGGSTNAQWDMTDRINPNGPPGTDTADGVECLIHATGAGTGQGQDTINLGSWPSGPMQVNASGGANLVTTSSSIVSIPIIDVTTPGAFSASTGAVTVIGFLQAFVEQVNANLNPNDIQIKVMNVVGCSQTNNGAPAIIGGNSSSPIPVRLITPP
jgi:hypothetical protein